MNIFKYERYTVYQLYKSRKNSCKNILLIKNTKPHTIKIYFSKNCKFYFSFRNLKYINCVIRLPFFYFLKNNGCIDIGLNNLYFKFNY